MSHFEDQSLFSPEVPVDTADFEDNIFKDVLDEETDPLVSILQSNSDLLSESKGVKVGRES